MARRRPVGTTSFHAARWRLEPLLTPAVTIFVLLLAALLYVTVTGLLAGPGTPVAGNATSLAVAVLFVLFLLGLAWSVYATLRAPGRLRVRRG